MALTHVITQLPTAFINKTYYAQLQGAGGTAPYTFSMASASPTEGLPAGLSLVGSAITGTVVDDSLVKEGYTVRIRVTDATATTVDYIYPLRVRIQTAKVDYKLDREIEDTYYASQHVDATFKLHLLLAKLLYWGIDNAEEELTPAESTLVRNWLDVTTGLTADVDLNTVLGQLRAWTNEVAYPEFELITATVPGPGADEVTITITSASQDIFVGPTPADYTEYFLLVNTAYKSYTSIDNTVFKVKSVTPTAPVGGLTTAVSIVCGYSPNPSAVAPPIPNFYCVYSKSAEVRDIPVTTVNSLFKLILGTLESIVTSGLQKINSVGPDSAGALGLTSAQASVFENADHNTIGVNVPTAGTFNNKSVPGINIKGKGITSVSANQRSELLIPKINSVSDLDSFSTSKREITTELANTIAIEAQEILMTNIRDAIKPDQSSNTHLINDRYYRGAVVPTLPPHVPRTRGDTKASYDGRAFDAASDVTQILTKGLSWNQADHPTQVGKVAITQTPAYGTLTWPRTMANEIYSVEYVDRVLGENQIRLTKALFWLSPFLRTTFSFDLVMTYWDDTAGPAAWVTTKLAYYNGGVPSWTSAVAWGKVEYYDDNGVAGGVGAEETLTLASGVFSLNAGYEITNVANFIAAIGGKSKIVIFHLATPAAGAYTEYSNPTYVFVEVDTAATLSAFAFTSLPSPISISGVEYYSGDEPANFTMTITGLGSAYADGVTPITRDYPLEFLSLTHGSTWLPATTSIVANAAQLGVAHLGNNIAMQDFLKDSGYTEQPAPSISYDNIIEVWAGGGECILEIEPSDAALVIGTTYPIMKTTANGNLTHELTNAFNNDEKTELFVDEHYRVDPSDHNAFDQYIKPMQPNVGRTNLWGWRGDISLPVGSLEAGSFVNPGFGDIYTIGGRKYYDGSYIIPGLRMPQENYVTTRAAYPGTNYDYSARTADGYYYRVFNLSKPTTNLDAIKIYGFYNGTAIDMAHLVAAGVLLEISVKVPGPEAHTWTNITAGTLSNITFGATTVGVQSANLGLVGNTVDGNYLLVVRIKITNDTPASNCNKYVITGIDLE